MKRIIAFAESNSIIGSGHLVRTIQLLSCLDEQLFKIDFYCNYDEAPQWLNEVDHKLIEREKFFELDMEDFDLLIFDSYENRDILEKVTIKTLLIDDFCFLGNGNKAQIILDFNYQTSERFYDKSKTLLGTSFFPIGKNTFPEFCGESAWSPKSKKILISAGGVSDKSLLDIDYLIELASLYGEIILMDPLSKLDKFTGKNIEIIKNESLSNVLSKEKFLFGIIAGGTSKYIAAAYSLPSLLIPRNDIEEFLIEKFLEDNLSINMDFLVDRPQEKLLMKHFSIISNNLNKIISEKNVFRLQKEILAL